MINEKKKGVRDKSQPVPSTETSLGSSSSGLVPQRPAPPPPPKLPDIQDQEEQYYSLTPHGETSTPPSLFGPTAPRLFYYSYGSLASVYSIHMHYFYIIFLLLQ